jgi:hypothetical protein
MHNCTHWLLIQTKGAENKIGSYGIFQEDNGWPFWQNSDFLTNENTIGTNVAYTDADQAQYHYAPAEDAAAYTGEEPVNNYSHGDAYAQSSSINAGPVEGSAEGPGPEEYERDEHYSPGFTNSGISIPYTWLLNGA